ncbi:putative bifunctional diguanylate cyclase/phosphodiesterase [Paraglaciecola sp. 2405UD69-4]|uniref:putative bifunctional diguanylate cyclase/phosphodiesterase n=1 Tax=Paraglaciecola sp. 2405UD69-4 TaxID=3391836 RepID=UPI0039C9A2B9
MRIRSYLAILVLSCLLGAYMLEQVLNYHFEHVQASASKHTKSLLWAKDLERIDNSASQYLVTTDLVVASGNTYLIFGAKNMGDYLTAELAKLQSQSPFVSINNKIENAIININEINGYLDIIGRTPEDDLPMQLRDLLAVYDPASLALFQNLEFISKEVTASIQKDAKYLEQEKALMEQVGWIARIIFLLLIIALWWWANRKICKPLNGLIASSHKALKGSDFQSTNNAPSEIIELSNDFKLLTQTLFHQASHDPLTELHNRRVFERNLSDIIDDQKHSYFLCFIDLDYFKTINDTCGHAAGDEILVSVARILKENVRPQDTVARLGGDEFAILLKDYSVSSALLVANSIKDSIRDLTYHWEDETFQLSASIGLAPKLSESTTTNLLNSADIACSLSKNAGRNTVHLYDASNQSSAEKQQEMLSVHQINNAINNDLFILYKQDIVPLQQQKSGKHFEILLRMLDSNDNIVSPANFFPIAERYKLSSKIDRWVLNAVCEHFEKHINQVDNMDTVSINLSGHSLTDNDLEKFIIDKIKHSRLPPAKICFEITETAAITNTKRARDFIHNINNLGCKFALDDFGSGHSSYAHIKEFPTNKIKIDGTFIANMMGNPLDYTAVKSICEIAKTAGQEVIAEFVEEADVVEALTKLGVDYAQGYYFSKPEPLAPTS